MHFSKEIAILLLSLVIGKKNSKNVLIPHGIISFANPTNTHIMFLALYKVGVS